MPLHHTVNNALPSANWPGPDLPVYAGCTTPISRRLVTAEHVHGKTALTASPPAPRHAGGLRHAVDFLIETPVREPLDRHAGPHRPADEYRHCAFAPRPDIVCRVQEIMLMGGAISRSAPSPPAEFNIYRPLRPPETVLCRRVPLTMMLPGRDPPALTSAWSRACAPWAASVRPSQADRFLRTLRPREIQQRAHPARPTTIAWLLEPGPVLAGRHINVEIETRGEFTLA